MTNSKTKKNKRQRFAIYTRYSSEMQNDLSLEAQEERCRRTIAVDSELHHTADRPRASSSNASVGCPGVYRGSPWRA